jgi:hypothetical protein
MDSMRGLASYNKGRKYENQILSLFRSEGFLCWKWDQIPLHILVDSEHCRFQNNNFLLTLSGLSSNPLRDTGVDMVILRADTNQGLRELVFVQIKNYEDMLSINDLSGFLLWVLHAGDNISGLVVYSGRLTRELREWENVGKLKFRHVPYEENTILKRYPDPSIPIRKLVPSSELHPFDVFEYKGE